MAILGFGAAMAVRETIDPWWSNAVTALVVIALAAISAGERQRTWLQLRWRSMVFAAGLGLVMVACTHLGFRLFSQLVPDLPHDVARLYRVLDQSNPGLMLALPLTALVVFGEELVFRGIAIDLLRQRLAPGLAAVTAVVLYALPQIIGRSWVLMVAAVAVGTVAAAQRLATGRIVEPFITHAIWSLSVFHLAPLL